MVGTGRLRRRRRFPGAIQHDDGEVRHVMEAIVRSEGVEGNRLPLAFLSEGEEGEVIELRGGRGMVQRLSDMGFTPGTRVKVLASNPPGPMLVDVRGTRIALGRGLVMKMIVNGGRMRW